MALKTMGSNGTTTLSALQWTAAASDGDIAAFNALCFDQDVLGGALNQAFKPGTGVQRPINSLNKAGILTTQRGTSVLKQNDWVVVDPIVGFPFVVPFNANPVTLTATGSTTTSLATITFASSVLALGWTPGMPIAGSNVPANNFIMSINSTGLTVTTNSTQTGTANNTMTAGNWTHT